MGLNPNRQNVVYAPVWVQWIPAFAGITEEARPKALEERRLAKN